MKKISRVLVKKILAFVSELEDLKCQKYSQGKCRDFASGLSTGNDEYCSACQIREGSLLIKRGAEKYNPQQIIF